MRGQRQAVADQGAGTTDALAHHVHDCSSRAVRIANRRAEAPYARFRGDSGRRRKGHAGARGAAATCDETSQQPQRRVPEAQEATSSFNLAPFPTPRLFVPVPSRAKGGAFCRPSTAWAKVRPLRNRRRREPGRRDALPPRRPPRRAEVPALRCAFRRWQRLPAVPSRASPRPISRPLAVTRVTASPGPKSPRTPGPPTGSTLVPLATTASPRPRLKSALRVGRKVKAIQCLRA